VDSVGQVGEGVGVEPVRHPDGEFNDAGRPPRTPIILLGLDGVRELAEHLGALKVGHHLDLQLGGAGLRGRHQNGAP
jgi:hypothetical protein